MGGWGIKFLPRFSKALVAKSVWNLISGTGIWNRIIQYKYIAPLSITEWIRVTDSYSLQSSIFWKVITKSFDLIGGWFSWKTGKDKSVRIGKDSWVGGNEFVCFPADMIHNLS